jgi:hypothetical protein
MNEFQAFTALVLNSVMDSVDLLKVLRHRLQLKPILCKKICEEIRGIETKRPFD